MPDLEKLLLRGGGGTGAKSIASTMFPQTGFAVSYHHGAMGLYRSFFSFFSFSFLFVLPAISTTRYIWTIGDPFATLLIIMLRTMPIMPGSVYFLFYFSLLLKRGTCTTPRPQNN